jgi:hypothetical protein
MFLDPLSVRVNGFYKALMGATALSASFGEFIIFYTDFLEA